MKRRRPNRCGCLSRIHGIQRATVWSGPPRQIPHREAVPFGGLGPGRVQRPALDGRLAQELLSSGLSRGGALAATPADLVQGTLDMLILNLALEPLHGYGIGLRIQQISRGVFQVNPGSLFPAFRRLERQGLIKPEWRATENNRRAKYYALTEPGRKKLKRDTEEWKTQTAAIARILAASSGEVS